LQSLKVPLPTMIMTSSYKKHGLEKLWEHIQKKLITCK
jgi:hypothetical protein